MAVLRSIEAAYEGTRFDSANASLQQCTLLVEAADSSACDKGRNTKSKRIYFVLAPHRINPFFRVSGETDGKKRVIVRVEPVGKWKNDISEVKNIHANILKRVRNETGWGRAAAQYATARFLSERSLDEFRYVTVNETCEGGQDILVIRSVVPIASDKPDEIIHALIDAFEGCKTSEL